MLSKQYYVYIITNRHNTVLYTGVTNNLCKRILEHKTKSVEGFTKYYNIDKLVYFESTDNVNSAITREKEIKGWVRVKKIKLIESLNIDWKDLYTEFCDEQ